MKITNINYELAKKMKEMGFPFKEIKVGYNLPLHWEHLDFNDGTHYYEPTLGELIEACGKQFYMLRKLDEKWFEALPPFEMLKKKGKWKNVWADTPEEAVANLWLAIAKIQ